jgi:hypothetical protein
MKSLLEFFKFSYHLDAEAEHLLGVCMGLCHVELNVCILNVLN